MRWTSQAKIQNRVDILREVQLLSRGHRIELLYIWLIPCPIKWRKGAHHHMQETNRKSEVRARSRSLEGWGDEARWEEDQSITSLWGPLQAIEIVSELQAWRYNWHCVWRIINQVLDAEEAHELNQTSRVQHLGHPLLCLAVHHPATEAQDGGPCNQESGRHGWLPHDSYRCHENSWWQ